ncbi:MAG: phosphonate ABC transporter substrate-binding protein [Deltaproteobacteria bacterium]|nr:phosphonate ABC transporter substrate-binding protein [Candidatus Anaeroferrophillacea bacterium]
MATLLLVVMMLAATVVGATAADETEVKEINFGIISTDSTEALKKGFAPFLADMEKALGIPVKPFFAGDYAGVIEAMRFNKVHVAWFGNKSAIEAVDRSNGEVFAQQVDANGDPGYWSLIITHKDSGIESIDDIIKRGSELVFGNGDVNSTSGYLIPSYYLWAKNNIDPRKHFKVARNANHAANVMAVAMKQVDFATNNTESLAKFQKKHPEMADKIRVLWKSPMIPKDPLVWRKDLPRELKSAIKGFILSYGRFGADVERQRQVLAGAASGLAPFWDSSNRQLIPIREIKFAKEIAKIQSDEHLSAAERQAKIAVIEAKIAEIREFAGYLDTY